MAEAIILSILERIGNLSERLSWWAYGRRSVIELRRLHRLALRAPGPRTFVVRDGLFGRDRPQLVSSTPSLAAPPRAPEPETLEIPPARRRAAAG